MKIHHDILIVLKVEVGNRYLYRIFFFCRDGALTAELMYDAILRARGRRIVVTHVHIHRYIHIYIHIYIHTYITIAFFSICVGLAQARPNNLS